MFQTQTQTLTRLVLVLCAPLVMAITPVSAGAQPARQVPRVVQSADGTLYLVQGSKSWTLVPDQLSDSDAAQLAPTGEIDGTLPNELFVVQAPAQPPAAAPAPADVQAPAPPPAPAPLTGTADLTGKAATDVPGTPIAVGATISSVVDRNSRPKEVFAINLTAGKTYQFIFSSPNHYGIANGACGVTSTLLNQDLSQAASIVQAPDAGYKDPLTYTPAVSATYYLQATASCTGSKYTFTSKES